MSRAGHRLTAKLLVAALLFLQLAVAAYACPSLNQHSGAPMPAAMVEATQIDSGCPMEDQAQPNLCSQHCQQGSQALDQSPPAVPAIPALPLIAIVDSAATPPCVVSAAPREFLRRATAPPPAIRFCVFRI